MSVIVTDTGFNAEDWPAGFLDLDCLRVSETAGHGLDLPNDIKVDDLRGFLDRLAIIRVDFPSFADGRGFSVAKRLRLLGYKGRLRARGHVLADQYAHARRSGFDEVEISDDLAARQPASQWLRRSRWQQGDYQSRLRKAS